MKPMFKEEIKMEGKKVKVLITWDKEKLNSKEDIEITGRYLGIMYYGEQCNEGCFTDTCLLVVDDNTGKVLEVGCGNVTFLE